MSVRRTLRRAVGVTTLTALGLTVTPLVGSAVALDGPTAVVPADGTTVGKRPVISATYAAALNRDLTEVRVTHDDAPTTDLGGSVVFSNDDKTVSYVLTGDLSDANNSFNVTLLAVPKSPTDLPPDEHQWSFDVDSTAPAAPTVTVAPPRTNSTVAVSGATDPNTAVSVSVANPTGGTPVVANTTSNGSGAYSVSGLSVTGLADGVVRATVTATDAYGNKASASGDAVKDTVAPARTTTTPADGATTKTRDSVTVRFDEALDTAASTIVVKNGVGSTLGGVKTFADGNTALVFTATSPMTPLGGVFSVTTTAVDSIGNSRTTTSTFSVDDTAPAAPSVTLADPINAANAAGTPVTGAAEPGSTVGVSVVRVNDLGVAVGSPVTASGTADAGTGAYSIPVDVRPLEDGKVRATVTATDAATNTSAAALSNVVTKDTVAPAAPTVDMTSPVSATRGVTVSGVADPASTVFVSVDDTDATTPPVTRTVSSVGGDGAYSTSLTLTGLKDGVVTATVTATDAAGNTSPAGTDTATLDTGLPQAPTVSMPTVNDANKADVAATGVAEPGSAVTVTVSDGTHDALTKTVTAAAQGGAYSASFDTTGLDDGTLTVQAVAKDAAGNVSGTQSIGVVRDTVAPGAPTAVLPAWVNATTSQDGIEVSGTAEPGARVDVTFGDTSVDTADVTASAVASPTGAWSTTAVLKTLADGAITAKATATDPAGNTGATETATTQKDVVAPAAPAVTLTDPITPANVATSAVSGTAATGSAMAVSVNDTDATTPAVTGTGTAASGAYSVPVDLSSLSDGEVTATATATDAAGNTSAPGSTAYASVKDTITLARTATSPADGATVAPPATVSATYNEPLSSAQTTIAVRDKTMSVLAGATTFSADKRTVVFTPVDTLSDAGSPYTVTLSARDTDGSDLSDTAFSFTVDATPPAAPSIVLPDVNAANDQAVEVTGAAEPGSTVAITVDDATAGSPVTATALADAVTGAYAATLDLTGLADGALAGAAVATDGAGNPSPAGVTTAVKDATAPVVPTLVLPAYVNGANKAAVPVSGVTEKGASVLIAVDDATAGDPVTKTVTADGSGAYATDLDLSGLADGALTGTAVATDAAGNSSAAGTGSSTKDVVAPAAPGVALPEWVNAATKAAVALTGTAEPGATVLVTVDDATAGDAVVKAADADATTGEYGASLDLSGLADGPVTATATVADAAGNVSAAGTDTATKDTVAPVTPSITFTTDKAGSWNAHQFGFSGTAEPHSVLTLSVDDEGAGPPAVATFSTYDDGPDFLGAIDLSNLMDGPLAMSLSSTDAAGNAAAPVTGALAKDTEGPAAPTVSLPDVNASNQSPATATGVAEPGSYVYITVDDEVPGEPVTTNGFPADATTGEYSVLVDVSSLPDGTLNVRAQALDAFGNFGALGYAAALKDTAVPAAPTVGMADPVNAAGTTSVSVGGVAEPGSTVTVTVDDANPGDALRKTLTADQGTGGYSTTFDVTPLADGPLTATVTATDRVGNVSPPATDTSVKDSTIPDVPVLAPPAAVTRASRAAAPFSGTAEPGSTVTVTVDDADDTTAAVTGTTVTGTDGAWTKALDVMALKDGNLSVSVTATDAVSNTSAATTGSAVKNVTRAFTIAVSQAPVSGAAQTVTVTAHTTYEIGSPADTTYTGTPALASFDGHFTAGTCSPAVDGVATCTGTTFGDLGQQALSATSGSGEDLVSGMSAVRVQPVSLAYGTPPPASAEPNVPITFTVVPTVGVAGASTAGYTATRRVVTRGGSNPAAGTALTCPEAECTVSVTFLDRGVKSVWVTDNGTPSLGTPVAVVRIPYVTQLSIAASRSTVNAGSYVTLSGKLLNTSTLAGVAGKQIAIYRKVAPGTTFRPYTTATTAIDGTWVKRVALTRNTTYQARFLAQPDYNGSVSPDKLVKAAQVVTSGWSRTGRTVTVAGKVSPNAAGRKVYLQYRRSDGTWASAQASAVVTSTGSYRMTRTFTAGRVLRVAIAATSVNAAGYSKAYTLP